MRHTTRYSTLAMLGGTAAGLAGATAATALVVRSLRRRRHSQTLHCPLDQLTFEEVMPGVSRAVINGDPDRGAYAAFTRFEPGFRVGRHTHPHDMTLLVVEGAYVYGIGEEGLAPSRVEAVSFLLVPAGLVHWSGGDEKKGALFFEESSGPFGLDLLH